MDLDLFSSSEDETDKSPIQDYDLDDDAHDKLLNAISSLDNRKRNIIKERTESSAKFDEFHLTEGNEQKSNIGDLLGNLRRSGKHVKLKKQLRTASKQRLVEPPLSKPQTERTQRAVVYNKASTEVDKWNDIVHKNRLAEQIVYPLKQANLSIQTVEEVAKRFTPKTSMELEIANALQTSKNVMTNKRELTVAEEEALKAMSLEEAVQRRNELRKMRALQSYQEAKARRQNKIKSKKYHRILKKDKLKKKMKEFEELQKTDPELALEKLEEMDKSRIGERMSLKHRNTGKWAKHNMIRAKYDDQARQALKDQVAINKNLTQKKKEIVSESEEEAELLIEMEKRNETGSAKSDAIYAKSTDSAVNPWLKPMNSNSDNKGFAVEKPDESDDDETMNESLIRKKSLEEYSQETSADDRTKSRSNVAKKRAKIEAKPSKPAEVDPTKFMSLQSKELKSQAPDLSRVDEEIMAAVEDDDVQEQVDKSQYMTIAEAFADDDVIDEFKTEKEDVVKDERPKEIDLTLPGWGSWGGTGIKISSRKRQRFTVKPDPGPPRKDHSLGNVIISQNENPHVAKHQVNELPHPFTNIKQFQNSVRMPIGRTWNPETAFQALTKPSIVTKMGTIIEPIDSEALVDQQNKKTNANRKERHEHNKSKGKIRKQNRKTKS